MFVKEYFLFGAIVFFMSVRQGDSLRCYECNSHLNADCIEDKLPESYLRECKPEFVSCRKIKQVIDFSVNGLGPDNRIIRTCGKKQDSYNNNCYQRSGFGGRQEVCACDNADACNVSSTIFMSSFLLVGALLLVKLSV